MVDQTAPAYMTEHVRNVGLLALTTSSFDYELGTLICECFCLTSLQETALVRPLGTRAKIDIVHRLAKYVYDKPTSRSEQKVITSWCEAAKDRLNERNTVIHAMPGIHEGKIMLRLFSAATAFGGKMEEWPIERVAKLQGAIRDLHKEIGSKIRPLFEDWIEASRRYVGERQSGA